MRGSQAMRRVNEIVARIGPIEPDIMEGAQKRLDSLTKPLGSLGRLEELAKRIAGITGRLNPDLRNKVIVTLAGDHGVAEEGISAYPQEVTVQMVHNFVRGGAAINILAEHVGAKVVVVDMGVKADLEGCSSLLIKKIDYGTENFLKGPAMSREESLRSIEAGVQVVDELSENGLDILGIGDMGIGNTTPSSAIAAVFTGLDAYEVTGRGTGINDETLRRKSDVIQRSLATNQPDPKDPTGVLARLGGFEIGGLAGCVLGAAARRIPVVIDGLVSTAGALIACELAPQARQYIIASHLSQEVAHKVMLDRMRLSPLLDLSLRLGEGTGAALGISLVEASVRILTNMATFEEAGVSQAEEPE
jgi:nicotinate-nucleotide--dimethylbenzimidazole phosphoribosyltransferase